MVFRFLKAFSRGAEDARATLVEQKFDELLHGLEEADSETQHTTAAEVEALLRTFKEISCRSLPSHCHENFLIFMEPKDIRREGEQMIRHGEERLNRKDPSAYPLLLVGHFLVSQSWQNETARSSDLDAMLTSSPFIQIRIRERLSNFLSRNGRQLIT